MKGSWVGRILSAIAALFLLMDAGMTIFQPPIVVEESPQLGFPNLITLQIEEIVVACTLLYIVPQTAFLGGALASQKRIGASVFGILFPLIIAIMPWGGLWLRDRTLRETLILRVTPR